MRENKMAAYKFWRKHRSKIMTVLTILLIISSILFPAFGAAWILIMIFGFFFWVINESWKDHFGDD